MSKEKSHLAELISGLKRQRDELALKIHLGKADAKEEWNKVTRKLDELTREYEPLKDAVGETAENLLAGLKLMTEEVQKGFNRIRKSL
jgi:chromosome segregation ATPase